MATADTNEEAFKSNVSMPIGSGKYNNTQVGWLAKRSRHMKKWRPRFCLLRMSDCLMITYKQPFDQVTDVRVLNDKKNQTDSIIFGDISLIEDIEFDENGEEIEYKKGKNEKNLKISKDYFGFRVIINPSISRVNPSILSKKQWEFKCQYEGFDPQIIKYQKKHFDSYVFRCKSKLATQCWIDLISDCIIRAKYYNANNLKNNLFSFIKHETDREIKYYRLLLGLPHNNKITILWEKLGFALSMKEDKDDASIFNACCNAFETAHSQNKSDCKILYNFINALDNFREVNGCTKNRISKTLMLYNRIQHLYNNRSMDFYGFCKFLFENKCFKLLENALNKLLSTSNIQKSGLDQFTQIDYWTKLMNIYDIDNKDNNEHDICVILKQPSTSNIKTNIK
eukprot:60340_1